MVKNWADHCSSDEEEDDTIQKEAVQRRQEVEREAAAALEAEDAALAAAEKKRLETPPEPKVYTYPTQPPFTAFVGNLSYNITENSDLATAVAELVQSKLNTRIQIVEALVLKDRSQNDKPRGFGYVEVETVEQLKSLMELNTAPGGPPQLAGRNVQFDISTGKRNNNSGSNRGSFRGSRNSGGFENIDGSKFRGGRHSQSFRDNGTEEGKEPPKERPSLKLKPRSKTAVGSDNVGGSSSSRSIFGDAKPRDEGSWRERRVSEKSSSSATEATRPNSGGRGGGRGGRDDDRGSSRGLGSRHGGRTPSSRNGNESNGGRGSSGRDNSERRSSGRGRGGEKSRDVKTDATNGGKSEKPAATGTFSKSTAKATVEAEKAAVSKKPVLNTFAALAMDSDSD